MWPMGEPVNYKYLPDKSPARSIGEYLRHYSTSDDHNAVVAAECMRIYSKKYPKALPPIKFTLLLNAINISEATELHGMSLACHQAAVSPSAKDYLSDCLVGNVFYSMVLFYRFDI